VYRLSIDAGITNGTADYVQAALKAASEAHAQALLIELDTPGGLLDATREIVQAILRAPLPVIVYVAPAGARAGSAGLFLVQASHVAVMHPTSNIGAAHPVGAFGGDIEGTMAKKIENDTAAWVRALAQSRSRNSEWAEQAVVKSESVTAREAERLGAIDFLAVDEAELLARADGRIVDVRDAPWRVTTRDAKAVPFERNLKQTAHAVLADPVLVYLLLLLGILGIYVEIQHPGLFLPGILGAACLLLVFGVQALPLNSLGVLLIVLSALLFLAEVYVTSFGLLSVAAIGALLAGSFMLFDVEGSSFRLNPAVVWATAAGFALLVLSIGRKLLTARHQGATSGLATKLGQEAVVLELIPEGGRGKVAFDGSYWDATSSTRLEPHTRCTVDAVDGLLLHVNAKSNHELD
jgi:membrane-bound serine protease (ClpP class)